MSSPEIMTESSDPARVDRLGVFMRGFGLEVAAILDGDDPAPAELHVGVSPSWAALVPTHLQGQPLKRSALFKVAFRHAAGGNPLFLALRDVQIADLDESTPLSMLIGLAAAEWRSPRCGRSAMLHNLAMAVMIHLMRDLMQRTDHAPGMLMGLSHRSLHRALGAVHEHPERPWSVPELAEIAGMSRSAFIATFSAHVGLTPGAYLTRWRVTKARTLIEQGSTVKSASRAVGFGSAEALSRAFKRHTGASPRERHAVDRPGSFGGGLV